MVDRDYGPRLELLMASGRVWIVDTELNRKAALDHWLLNPDPNPEAVVTTFNALPTDSASEICIAILPMLDLHHGEYSGGYDVLDVIGVELNEEIRVAVEELGFREFVSTAEGFRASR